MQKSGEPLGLEMKAIKMNGKARSSTSFLSIFSAIPSLNWVKEKSDFSRFYKYSGIAVKSILFRSAAFIALLHLIQFCFWNKTMLSTCIFYHKYINDFTASKHYKKLFSKWDGRHCQKLIIWIHFLALPQNPWYIQVVELLFALVSKLCKKQHNAQHYCEALLVQTSFFHFSY